MKIGPFILTESGMFLDRPPVLEEWDGYTEMVFDMQRYVPWWIGDLVNYGEANFGDDVWQVVPMDVSENMVQRFASVAKKYPAEDRVPQVSWSHHVAALSIANKKLRQSLLKKAARDMMDGSAFRELIKDYK